MDYLWGNVIDRFLVLTVESLASGAEVHQVRNELQKYICLCDRDERIRLSPAERRRLLKVEKQLRAFVAWRSLGLYVRFEDLQGTSVD